MAWFRTRRFGWVAVLSLLAPGAGRGQEALRSAMELDQTIAAYTNGPVALTPNIHHWGPVPFTVGAYAGTTYDDNINEAQDNPESDIVLSAGVNLGASWAPTGQSQLQLGTGIGYIRYLKNTQNSGLSVTPDSAVTYAVVLKERHGHGFRPVQLFPAGHHGRRAGQRQCLPAIRQHHWHARRLESGTMDVPGGVQS